jgi:5-methyltetrahydropteroyltriglutamate--homocysteine methyltransferase
MKLPLLPTTGVGSFPKPDYVKGANGKLDENSKKATREFIKRQEELDIDVLVDGEFYRGDMATDYYRALGLPTADWTRSYDNRFWKKGTVDRPLQRSAAIQLDQFKYAQSLTQRPVKAILTGPTTLANWGFNSHYQSREDLVFSWAKIVREEAMDLVKAGARYLQVDEPAVAERYWETDLFREGLGKVTEGLDAYTITHVCYGEFPLVYPNMPKLPVDQIDIELASELDLGLERSSLLQMMKNDPLTNYKDVAVGVIDVRPGVGIEDVEKVRKRIETALEILAPTDETRRRIWIDPDCGFRTTKNREIAYKKMEVMMEAVKQARKSL